MPCCAVQRDGSGELKEDLIKTYTDLLQKYLSHDEDRELQALYALQALVNRLEHPKGEQGGESLVGAGGC